MTIQNTSIIKENHIDDLRGAIEHRATWFYLLLDEARKRGLEWDDFARAAIFKCGCFHGENKFANTDDLVSFANEFANENVIKIFEMDIKEKTDKKFVIEFNYCPLVAAWEKLTDNEEDIAQLCDIAMDGDRGIIDTFKDFEFDLPGTIAKGDKVCTVVITKK